MINTHNFEKIQGKYINLREAQIEDSAFILSLRTDPNKSQFLNKTENSLEKQEAYMRRYKTLDNEWYYIIERAVKNPVRQDELPPKSLKQSRNDLTVQSCMSEAIGVISIYPNNVLPQDSDIRMRWLMQHNIIRDRAKAISSGRWIMSEKADYLQVLESVYMIRNILFCEFGIDFEPFTVKNINKKVLSFHKQWGAQVVHEENELLFLELSKENFLKNKIKFEKILGYEEDSM